MGTEKGIKRENHGSGTRVKKEFQGQFKGRQCLLAAREKEEIVTLIQSMGEVKALPAEKETQAKVLPEITETMVKVPLAITKSQAKALLAITEAHAKAQAKLQARAPLEITETTQELQTKAPPQLLEIHKALPIITQIHLAIQTQRM